MATPAAARAHYVLALLTCMSAVSFMDRQILAVLIEPVKGEFGLSDLQIGLVTGLGFALAFAVFGVPLGRLADRHERRTLIARCRGLGGAIAALGAAAGGFWSLMATRAGTALNDAGGMPASISTIADLYPPEQRSRAMAVFGMGASAGALLALVLGAWLAQQLGWRATLAIVGLSSVALALLFRFSVREAPRHAPVAAAARSHGALAAIWRTPVTRWLILAAAFAQLAGQSFGVWNFAFLVRIHGMSSQTAGFVSGMAAVGSVLGGLAAGALTDRLIRRDLRWQLGIPVVGVALALPMGLVYLTMDADQAFVAAGLVITFAFFIAWWIAPTYAAISLVVPSRRRATTSAVLLLVGSIVGSGIGPALTGGLSDLLVPLVRGESLRYALACMVALLAASAFAFAKAMNAYPAARRALTLAGEAA